MLVPIDGYHLRTVDLGQGPSLLLHDGWVASWELWLPLIEQLHDHWRCIAYDHRGAGASTFPADEIRADALASDVFRVMDAHGVDRCVIAGESLGCVVAMLAVLQAPKRFDGLVVVGGFPSTPSFSPADAERVMADCPASVDRFVRACLPEADAGPLHRWGCGTLLPAGPEAATRMTQAMACMAPEISRITVPTLVVHGAQDVVAPAAGGRQVAAGIPGAELVLLDDAGHVPILTRPREVAAAIDDWWSRVGPAAQT